jgi:hypothetical protein
MVSEDFVSKHLGNTQNLLRGHANLRMIGESFENPKQKTLKDFVSKHLRNTQNLLRKHANLPMISESFENPKRKT